MSVNRISQSHAQVTEAVQNVNSQKSPAANTKANAVEGTNDSRVHNDPASKTQQPANIDNNAGHEQGQRENTANDTNGTRVNVFA